MRSTEPCLKHGGWRAQSSQPQAATATTAAATGGVAAALVIDDLVAVVRRRLGRATAARHAEHASVLAALCGEDVPRHLLPSRRLALGSGEQRLQRHSFLLSLALRLFALDGILDRLGDLLASEAAVEEAVDLLFHRLSPLLGELLDALDQLLTAMPGLIQSHVVVLLSVVYSDNVLAAVEHRHPVVTLL